MKFRSLVFDDAIYPRGHVDGALVDDLVEALKTGATLPPIIVDKKTRKVVDGVHRAWAYRKFADDNEDAAVPIATKTYKSDTDMFIDALRLNARHGHRLSLGDCERIYGIGRRLRIDSEVLASNLALTTPKFLQHAITVETRTPN